MSIKLMQWVFDEVEATPTQRMILLAMADWADEDGVCWPSWKKLIDRVQVSRATLARNLILLEEAGFLQRENRHDNSGRQRANRYVLVGSQNETGGSHSCETGEGLICETPLKDTKDRTTNNPPTPHGGDAHEEGFEEFWREYPRRVDKQRAIRAYRSVLKQKLATPQQLQLSAARYRGEMAGQEVQFIKHPATWLNAGSYDNASSEPEISVRSNEEQRADDLRRWQSMGMRLTPEQEQIIRDNPVTT